MDDDEREFGRLDLEWRKQEFEQRAAQHQEQLEANHKAARVSLIAVLLSALAIVVTLVLTQQQYRQATKQFRQQFQQSTEEFETSSRDDHYNQIIAGLGSQAAAVQTNSMRLLTDFVQVQSNYDSEEAQHDGVEHAVQTLTAFIEDNSTDPKAPGLSKYQSPVPIILSRAMSRLRLLLGNESLGTHKADISRANLHGASMGYFQPEGGFLAVGTDFRRASLDGLDLRADPADLRSAFFTCASMRGAELGQADLDNADLTGADLTGANLSEVKNLEQAQVRGAVITDSTDLPKEIDRSAAPTWTDRPAHCYELVNDMTGMRGGQGYSTVLPCPVTIKAARAIEFDPPFAGDLTDLVQACRSRQSVD